MANTAIHSSCQTMADNRRTENLATWHESNNSGRNIDGGGGGCCCCCNIDSNTLPLPVMNDSAFYWSLVAVVTVVAGAPVRMQQEHRLGVTGAVRLVG